MTSRAPRPRVFVARALPGVAPLEALGAACAVEVWERDEPPPREALIARAAGCDGLLTMLTDRVDGALLDACATVRVVANMAVGFDNIDVPAATARGVLVTNTPGVLTETTADLAFALLLASARRLAEGEAAVRGGTWGAWNPSWLLGREVAGATLGIVGPGRIGGAVARRAQGFGMQVCYAGRRAVEGFPGSFVPLDVLLETSDFVSVHVPLNEETAGMFGDEAFARMKPTATFINTARGGLVDQAALARALRAGTIAAAALDVTTPEPLPAHDALLEAPHLLVTPHVGSATDVTRERMAALAVAGLLAGLAGERPPHLVNPDAWERRR